MLEFIPRSRSSPTRHRGQVAAPRPPGSCTGWLCRAGSFPTARSPIHRPPHTRESRSRARNRTLPRRAGPSNLTRSSREGPRPRRGAGERPPHRLARRRGLETSRPRRPACRCTGRSRRPPRAPNATRADRSIPPHQWPHAVILHLAKVLEERRPRAHVRRQRGLVPDLQSAQLAVRPALCQAHPTSRTQYFPLNSATHGELISQRAWRSDNGRPSTPSRRGS